MRARAATIAGFLGLATTVAATGSAIINNYCDFDVYLWPVSVDDSPSSAIVIPANGGNWNMQYKTCTSGGYSLKLSATESMNTGITQFEYTLDPGTIWYDISNVNCLPFGQGDCPFGATGMTLSSGSGCPVATCEAGNATCHDAYTYPDDNWASLSCDSSADTTMDLCGSSSSGIGGAVSSVVSQVTSAVGSLLGETSSSTEAPSTSSTSSTTVQPTTSTTPTPTPTPTPTSTSSSTTSSSSSSSSSSEAAPTPAAPSYPHHQWSPPAAVSDGNGVAAAAVPTSSEEKSSSSVVATTFATVAITTPAPEKPNVAVVYETVTTMVSTTVVYQHKMLHKERRGNAHQHARRHQHAE